MKSFWKEVFKLKDGGKCCDHLSAHTDCISMVSVYRIHQICVVQTDMFACIPSTYMDMSACAHQKAQKYFSYVHARQQCMHVGCYQNAKQQRITCCNRLILAEQQLIHFVIIYSSFLPCKQRTPLFPNQSHITCHSRQNLQMLLKLPESASW